MKRLDINDIATRIKEYSKNEYQLVSGQTYTNVHVKLNIWHTKCRKEFSMSIANLLCNKTKSISTGCTHCRYIKSGETQKYTHAEFIQSLDRSDINEYTILTKYKNTDTKLIVKHKCNNVYEVRPRELKQGNKCPFCSRSVGLARLSNLSPPEITLSAVKISKIRKELQTTRITVPQKNIALSAIDISIQKKDFLEKEDLLTLLKALEGLSLLEVLISDALLDIDTWTNLYDLLYDLRFIIKHIKVN